MLKKCLCDSDIELDCLFIASFITFFIRFMSFADFFISISVFSAHVSFFHHSTLSFVPSTWIILIWLSHRYILSHLIMSINEWCFFPLSLIKFEVVSFREIFFHIQFDVRISVVRIPIRLSNVKMGETNHEREWRKRNNIVHRSRIIYNNENTISNKEKRCITIKVVSSLNI